MGKEIPQQLRPQQGGTATLDDPRDEELARLRLENANLRKQQLPQLDSTAGPKRIFRVKLPSIQLRDGTQKYQPVNHVKFEVGPRQVLPGLQQLPDKYRSMPTDVFDGLELFLAKQEPWQAYAAKHRLSEGERQLFKIKSVREKVTEYLDVPAISEADAFEIYRRYSGILSTVHRPDVQVVPESN